MSREAGNIFALSLIPQVDYNTALVASGSPKNYEQIAKEGMSLAQYTTNPVTNAGYSTGTAYPTKSKVGSHDVTQVFNERMTAEGIGRRLLAAMGDYSVSLVATGVYKHIFKPLNPLLEAALYPYTYVEKIGEPALDADIIHELKYLSFMAESFNLNNPANAQNGAFLMGQTNWRGSGKQLGSAVAAQTGSGVNFYRSGTKHVVLDENKSENFFNSAGALFSLFPQASLAGTEEAIGCDFRGLQLNHNNNLLVNQGYEGCGKFQDQTDPNSGSVRGNLPIGTPTTDLSFSALVSKDIAQTFNPFNRLRAQSIFSLQLVWGGSFITTVSTVDYYRSLKLIANKLTCKSVNVTAEDTLNKYDIACETLAAGNVQPYQIELVNDIPTYLSL